MTNYDWNSRSVCTDQCLGGKGARAREISGSTGVKHDRGNLTSLPTELLLNIVAQFDLRNMMDIIGLKMLAQTCRIMHIVVQDAVRMKQAIQKAFQFERKIIGNHHWDLLGDAIDYNRYASYCERLVQEIVIGTKSSKSTSRQSSRLNWSQQNPASQLNTFSQSYSTSSSNLLAQQTSFVQTSAPSLLNLISQMTLSAQPSRHTQTVLPVPGWLNIFSVGLLLRAKLTGFGFDFPRKRTLDLTYKIKIAEEEIFTHPSALSPIEKMVLLYSSSFFSFVFPKHRALKDTDVRALGLNERQILRSVFLMEGPLYILRLLHGWEYWSALEQPVRFKITRLQPRDMAVLADLLFRERLHQCQNEPRRDVEQWLTNDAEEHVQSWAREYSSDKPGPFIELGLAKEGADTIVACMNLWASCEPRHLPWRRRWR